MFYFLILCVVLTSALGGKQYLGMLESFDQFTYLSTSFSQD